MLDLMAKYARDIPAILECVDKNYQVRPFFNKWEVYWQRNNKSARADTIREALASFKEKVVSTHVDPEEG
jgi:hypothetical protein